MLQQIGSLLKYVMFSHSRRHMCCSGWGQFNHIWAPLPSIDSATFPLTDLSKCQPCKTAETGEPSLRIGTVSNVSISLDAYLRNELGRGIREGCGGPSVRLGVVQRRECLPRISRGVTAFVIVAFFPNQYKIPVTGLKVAEGLAECYSRSFGWASWTQKLHSFGYMSSYCHEQLLVKNASCDVL